MRHTRGPWGILEIGKDWCITPITADGEIRGGNYTEDICHGSTLAKNWEENAALIAAAPTMLKMLQQMKIACDAAPPSWYKIAIKRHLDEVLWHAQEVQKEQK